MAITFKRIAPHESRIYEDGDCIGEVYRQRDILNPGQHHYIAYITEDPRGSFRIRDRSRIREMVEARVRSHPLF